MPISVRIEGEKRVFKLEGPVSVNGHRVIALVSEEVKNALTNSTQPVHFDREPGGFSVTVFDGQKPGGYTLADFAVIYPPITVESGA